MKNYIEQAPGNFTCEGMSIPATTANRHYSAMLREVAGGEATVEYYAGSAREVADMTAKSKAVAEQSVKEAKLAGVEFDSVMCSATAEDMWGLSAVANWVRAGQSTPFKFDNGNVLVLTPDNIDAFEAVWVPFRASFF